MKRNQRWPGGGELYLELNDQQAGKGIIEDQFMYNKINSFSVLRGA
jgi:hypothetical protein